MSEKVRYIMEKDKVCKHSVRYSTTGAQHDLNVYLPNEAVRKLGNPETITVDITSE